ncbi:unnamed protein product [Amoebophrya sp. A25]|nr:unnamed protein product [Amoebophrya sp. A25]|eukprot:GSA25T00025187001.1
MTLGDSNNDEASMLRVLSSQSTPVGEKPKFNRDNPSGNDIFVATASRTWSMGPCVNGDNIAPSPLLPDPFDNTGVTRPGILRVVPGFAPYAIKWFADRLWQKAPHLIDEKLTDMIAEDLLADAYNGAINNAVLEEGEAEEVLEKQDIPEDALSGSADAS